ncbi:MarR family transcriptional regulator [Metarhizobium album]|uniref:MarR family transcriptional regulator n=1 Tax=Metarhizobium album TaxID=2182425 RepID=A0A2U2DJQ8_9HYPH|nr:MarR family transcriptional regulator [Rhizobium album]PWE53546.1 MarR family transcriptional regulator [Rhizobium album]
MRNNAVERRLIEDVSAFGRKLKTVFEFLTRKQNITLPRMRVFASLVQKEGMNQRELAERLELETPTVVRLLDTMEAQGFVERRSSDTDRRAKEVHLTGFGRQTAEEVDSVAGALILRLVAGIPEEDLLTASAVIRTMQANLQSVRTS